VPGVAREQARFAPGGNNSPDRAPDGPIVSRGARIRAPRLR